MLNHCCGFIFIVNLPITVLSVYVFELTWERGRGPAELELAILVLRLLLFFLWLLSSPWLELASYRLDETAFWRWSLTKTCTSVYIVSHRARGWNVNLVDRVAFVHLELINDLLNWLWLCSLELFHLGGFQVIPRLSIFLDSCLIQSLWYSSSLILSAFLAIRKMNLVKILNLIVYIL